MRRSVVEVKGSITLAHGAGGKESALILKELIFDRVEERLKKVPGGLGIDFPDDGATIPMGDGGFLVVSMDSYTVNPLFFPGGDIGKLAACGSINDVVVMGARPIAMLDSIVVEEGFPLEDLERIVDSFLEVVRSERVAVIGGDFKVMPKGQLDGVVVSTVCLGISRRPIVDLPKPGDRIVVTGYLGDHGATILALQQGIELEGGDLKSDVAPLTRTVLPVMEEFGGHVHAARDPTRGGLAMVLNDWAQASETVIVVDGAKVPVRRKVRAYAEMLGIDPLYLASEGAAVLAVSPEVAEEVVKRLRELGCREAAVVGEVRKGTKYSGLVLYRSEVGGLRILEPPTGELVPRIC